MRKSLTKLTAAAAVSALLGGQSLAATGQPLAQILHGASQGRQFVLPAAGELLSVERLFSGLLAGQPTDALRELAVTLELELVPASAPEAWLVVEKSTARRGRGLFAFRAGHGDTLQVPHSFKDEMTREIGLALFAEGQFGAAAWNTVPRNFERDGARVDADMAHLQGTYFTAFTRAVAQARPRATIFQIHGFDPSKRKTEGAAAAELILSAGHTNPPASLRQRWQCVLQRTPVKAAMYPDTSRELGGTTNAQVALLLSTGYNNFVHAEMSRALRVRLSESAAERRQMLDCLQGDGR